MSCNIYVVFDYFLLINSLQNKSVTEAMTKEVFNETQVNGFVILGLSDSRELKVPLFLLFLFVWLITVLSNLVIITLICLDIHLQKPMYFFLCNMSFLDICYTTVTAPKLLHDIISDDQNVSFIGCMTQLFFFNSFGSMEYMLLTSMAYDRSHGRLAGWMTAPPIKGAWQSR
uniref:G-protein coupled receptors family 1 profile domain-containing protein n=1 Tax=Leptobrachium leishanense TaxID=445787 RepID=A0A8C5M979_9ANUR